VNLSVIICAHNPRPDYLHRVLEALKGQTLPGEQWELLLVDNASKESLAQAWDLSWHPRARHVREDEPGLTPARLRGIAESAAELLVFVDDDNVLAPDYLEAALQIRQAMPQMAVFGGKITGEFEVLPEPWMTPYLEMLALRQVDRDSWSNDPVRLGRYPCGAGMCVSRKVGEAYVEMLRRDPRRKWLDRRGSSLGSGGDDDICCTAGQLGLGVGMFSKLSLTHLIPKERLDESYLLRLVEGVNHSGYVLAYLWKRPIRPPVHSLRWRFAWWRMRKKMTEREQHFGDAKVRAERRAWETIREMERLERNGT
jgi:glycosyltransferase involved in cell wall biosynthesis